MKVGEDGNKRAKSMSALFQNPVLGLYRLYKPKPKEKKDKKKKDCLLDTNTAGDKYHVFDFLYIYSGRRPDKAAAHADIDFLTEDFFLGFPEPCSWWVAGGCLDG